MPWRESCRGVEATRAPGELVLSASLVRDALKSHVHPETLQEENGAICIPGAPTPIHLSIRCHFREPFPAAVQ